MEQKDGMPGLQGIKKREGQGVQRNLNNGEDFEDEGKVTRFEYLAL